MTDIHKRFAAAAKDVRSLPSEPGTRELLELYALYKQATAGDVSGLRPGAFDVRARAKHDAWSKAKGLEREDAMARYIALVERLRTQ
jgi:diazepam-binding inhibitor (GABA receptor modulator, acyl-CoA-binding protein)